MTRELITKNVDIFKSPELDVAHPADAGAHIISGDMHGNTIKPLFLTVEYGITTNISTLQYQNFIDIYKRSFGVPGLSAVDLLNFKQFLHDTHFKSEATIHWLGDMLADRGGNDLLTLLLLQRLRECGVKFEIILSNHDIEFINNYESPLADFSTTCILVIGSQYNSMTQLSQSLTQGLVTRKEINSLMQEAYLPALKLLSYTVNEEGTEITLLSHAPIGIPNVADLAKRFDVPYDETSVHGFAKTIDEINRIFIEFYVKMNRINDLISRTESANLHRNPVYFAIWNRDTEGLYRPDVIGNFRINYVHGHHSEEKPTLYPPHISNLDNILGKTLISANGNLVHNNKGLHSTIYSHEKINLHEIKPQQPIATSQHTCRNTELIPKKHHQIPLPPTKAIQEHGILITSVFYEEICKVQRDVFATNSKAKCKLLDELTRLKNEAFAAVKLKQNILATSMITLGMALLAGAREYYNTGNEPAFKQVCEDSFKTISPQLQLPTFANKREIFVALAKTIEQLQIGLRVEQLIPSSPILRVSDKQAAFSAAPSSTPNEPDAQPTSAPSNSS